MGKIKFIIFALIFGFISMHAHGKRNTSAYELYSKGVELAGKKKYNESIEKLEKAIELNPTYLGSYLEIARSMVMLGKRTMAMERLDVAAKNIKRSEDRKKLSQERALLSELFYTNNTFQLYQNGLNFLLMERNAAAAESLEKALNVEPDNVAILLAYARSLMDDNIKTSIKFLEKAFLLNPEKKEVRLILAELNLKNKPERSLELLRPSVLGKNASEPEVLVYVQALSLLEKNKQAIDILQEKMLGNMDWVESNFWLGKFYAQEAQGNWMARKYLMTFLKRTNAKNTHKGLKDQAESLLLRVNQALQ